MISIFILFSKDRHQQIKQSMYFWEKMDHFDKCQKIILTDGPCPIINQNYEQIEVNRISKNYNWSSCWEAGVKESKFENILYLDSDRVLEKDFLKKIVFKKSAFSFPVGLWNLKKDLALSEIEKILNDPSEFQHVARYEKRSTDPLDCLGQKNPMSGCVAFTKEGYRIAGKVDPYYEGWGYPDTDYFLQTYKKNFEFIPIKTKELHIYHPSDKRKGFMNAWNGIKFCEKWNLPINKFLKNQCQNLGIDINEIKKYESMDDFINKKTKRTKLL